MAKPAAKRRKTVSHDGQSDGGPNKRTGGVDDNDSECTPSESDDSSSDSDSPPLQKPSQFSKRSGKAAPVTKRGHKKTPVSAKHDAPTRPSQPGDWGGSRGGSQISGKRGRARTGYEKPAAEESDASGADDDADDEGEPSLRRCLYAGDSVGKDRRAAGANQCLPTRSERLACAEARTAQTQTSPSRRDDRHGRRAQGRCSRTRARPLCQADPPAKGQLDQWDRFHGVHPQSARHQQQ